MKTALTLAALLIAGTAFAAPLGTRPMPRPANHMQDGPKAKSYGTQYRVMFFDKKLGRTVTTYITLVPGKPSGLSRIDRSGSYTNQLGGAPCANSSSNC